jgi:hypothetical protein
VTSSIQDEVLTRPRLLKGDRLIEDADDLRREAASRTQHLDRAYPARTEDGSGK